MVKLQKIKDERLLLKNLQNLRIAYMLQTIGIIGILGYDFITKGLDGMRKNPLWFVFILTTVVSAFLSMNISVEYESRKRSSKQSFLISLVVLTLISTIIGILTSFTEGFTAMNGVFIAGIVFLCGVVPISYVYYLRKKIDNQAD
ncbi:putative membrane protein [Geobacillus thermodenitrificans]|nr:putative membrane protein [Geobacillus thermodenitrificans]